MGFSKDFIWGAATAAYQIEGAAYEDGKGLSVWDMMCRKKDAIWKNQNGDIACDHYHRYKEDVALMSEIGLKGYRFSISWPRVIPEGVGAINTKGLEFYDKLVDELLKHNIQPFVTLFHWDFPYALYSKGGWLNRDSSDWFAEYTKIIVEKLSDRVMHWITFNEPQIFMHLGHSIGMHAPGDKLGFAQVLQASHNVLRAHGTAVTSIRAHAKKNVKVGFAFVGSARIPATESQDDIAAARTSMFSIDNKTISNNTWWMDTALLGHYPEDGLKLFAEDMPDIKNGDMEAICQPLDFLGFNNYMSPTVRAGDDGNPQITSRTLGHALTHFGWPVTPAGFYWGPKFFYERYNLPIYVTENGMSNVDWIALDGKVHDPQRIDFLHRYLREYKRAADEGIPLKGYFVWSSMDNFEWAAGFKERFGLIFVDYPTQKRILKDSAYWYQNVIKTNGDSLVGV